MAKQKTKEQLQEEINALTKEREELGKAHDELGKAHDELGKKLTANYNKLQTASRHLAELQFKSEDPAKCSWETLLAVVPGEGNYEMLQKKLYELWSPTTTHDYPPITNRNYRPDVMQYCLSFHLYKEHCTPQYLERIEKELEILVPHVKSHDGYKLFDILEPGMSEFNSYHIRLTDDGLWQLFNARRSERKPIKYETKVLKGFLQYLADNHSFYENSQDDD